MPEHDWNHELRFAESEQCGGLMSEIVAICRAGHERALRRIEGDNPRFVECPACLGECEFSHLTGYDPRDGSPTGWIEKCDYCGGKGEVEEDAVLIEEDDLLDRDQSEKVTAPEPHETIECLFCGDVHTGDCADVPSGESYSAWRARHEEELWAARSWRPVE